MKRIIVVAVAATLAACSVPVVVSRHSLSQAPYDSTKRDEVWARGLAEFQRRGALVSMCNEHAAVLTSQPQPTTTRCHGETCTAMVAYQLTLAGGVAMLRTNRAVSAYVGFSGGPFAPEEEAAFQSETDEFLSAVAGAPAVAVATRPVEPAADARAERSNATLRR